MSAGARWFLILSCLALARGPAAQLTTTWQHTSIRALLAARALERVDGVLVWADVRPQECAVCAGEKTTPCRACRAGKHQASKNCAECRGRKKVPCESCAGGGETLDPFVAMPCPGCATRARIPCRICLGVGRLDVVGGGTPSCPTCQAKGGERCGLCKGKRLVPVLEVGRTPLHEANAEMLRGLEKELEKLRERVDSFRDRAVRTRPKPNPADLEKPFALLVAQAEGLDKAWKRLPAQIEAVHRTLKRPRTGGVFSMRQISNDDIRRFTYRAAADSLEVWVGYHLALFHRSRMRLK